MSEPRGSYAGAHAQQRAGAGPGGHPYDQYQQRGEQFARAPQHGGYPRDSFGMDGHGRDSEFMGAGYGQGHDLGRGWRRPEDFAGPDFAKERIIALGNAFMGGKLGFFYHGEINNAKFRVVGDARDKAVCGGFLDRLESSTQRELKILTWAVVNRVNWRAFMKLAHTTYEVLKARVSGTRGGRFAWAGALAEGGTDNRLATSTAEICTVEMRLNTEYFHLCQIDGFVESRFARNQDTEVLAHIGEHFGRLQEAIREVHWHVNTVCLRSNMINKEFVENGFIGGLKDLHRSSLFGGTPTQQFSFGGGQGGLSSGGLTALGASTGGALGGSTGTATAARATGSGGGTGAGGAGALTAPYIAPFKSHLNDLAGNPYLNRKKLPYHGSVCDACELAGRPYQHHPLRCDVIHPKWNTPGGAPEANGITEWYRRPA
jgi:hypothetical protein